MIQLREIRESDLKEVQKHASHTEISRMSYVPSPYPKDGALSWFKFISPKIQSETAKVYVIELNGYFSGIMTLNKFLQAEKSTSIDYWVRADFHGQGIASKAVSLAIDVATSFGIRTFNSGCLAKNIGSKKVLLKNGFSIQESFVLEDGKYQGEEMLLFRQTRT
ncbi:GNAT family N-acetyltransferase [Vibrio nomapromontoriensis]|uniref:GNAT family N-acetyltransferase n=1 Tax=Vibrio nomapromontoriensis TaxID=2910246 RepID=UPI003D0A4D88